MVLGSNQLKHQNLKFESTFDFLNNQNELIQTIVSK